MTTVGFRYTIEWFTEYSDPPDGLPRIKAEMFESIEQRKERMKRGERPVPPTISQPCIRLVIIILLLSRQSRHLQNRYPKKDWHQSERKGWNEGSIRNSQCLPINLYLKP